MADIVSSPGQMPPRGRGEREGERTGELRHASKQAIQEVCQGADALLALLLVHLILAVGRHRGVWAPPSCLFTCCRWRLPFASPGGELPRRLFSCSRCPGAGSLRWCRSWVLCRRKTNTASGMVVSSTARGGWQSPGCRPSTGGCSSAGQLCHWHGEGGTLWCRTPGSCGRVFSGVRGGVVCAASGASQLREEVQYAAGGLLLPGNGAHWRRLPVQLPVVVALSAC
mmetsp:Transcript_22339/g.61958  ORF Transcript_22339/g.61958 Transcript_22339/m.61958 type:complete len:226 (+) Transcript_22339:78-755(+)